MEKMDLSQKRQEQMELPFLTYRANITGNQTGDQGLTVSCFFY